VEPEKRRGDGLWRQAADTMGIEPFDLMRGWRKEEEGGAGGRR